MEVDVKLTGFAAALLVLAGRMAEAQADGEWKGAQEYKGEHFVVRSDAPEKAARETLGWVEDVYAAFRQEFSDFVFETPAEGMTVLFFFTRRGLDEHIRTAHGGRAPLFQAPGFFSNEDKACHFTPDLPRGAQNTLEEIVKHESTHQLAFYAMPSEGDPTGRPHFWAWEGLATYFETTQRQGKKLVLGSSKALWMKKGKDLVRKREHDSWAKYVQYDQQGVRGHYPQAAVMVHYLMNARRGALRGKFLEYAKIVHAGKADAETFETVFGAKPEKFESEWAEYVRNIK